MLGRAHESGPDIGYSFNLHQSLNFSALGLLYLWEAGAGQMAPGTQYNGPSRSSRKLLRERSLRGSVTQPQGQEEVKPPPPKSCSRIRATRAGFLSSLYFRLISRAHPSPHVLRWRPVNSGYGGSLRESRPLGPSPLLLHPLRKNRTGVLPSPDLQRTQDVAVRRTS